MRKANNDTIIKESLMVLDLHKDRCKKILDKKERGTLTGKELIDFYISLHITLEVGINMVLRSFMFITSSDGNTSLYKKIDDSTERISFIDKIAMFIYTVPKINIKSEYDKHLKIIQRLKDFSRNRNLFIHGSSIYIKGEHKSNAKMLLSITEMKKQTKLFEDIFNDLIFHFDNLKYQPAKNKKNSFMIEYVFGDLIKKFK